MDPDASGTGKAWHAASHNHVRESRIRPDRGYFKRCHVNDTFPGRGPVEYQATPGEIINALISAGLEVQYVAEYAEPFWRPDGLERPRGPDDRPQA